MRKTISAISINMLTGEIQFYNSITKARILMKEQGAVTTEAKIKRRMEDKTILEDTWRVGFIDERITISDEQLEEVKNCNTELDLYSQDGRFYKRFKTAREVAFFLRIPRPSVLRAIITRKRLRGYKIFKKDEIPPWELDEKPVHEGKFISYGGKGKYKRTPVVAYNINTKEELFFKSIKDLGIHFDKMYGTNKASNINRHMTQLVENKTPYMGEWVFSYYEGEYKC